MITELKGSLYYLYSNLRYSLIVFWAVLMAVLAFSVISAILIEDSQVSFNLPVPMYLFAAIFGFWMVKNTIPYLIKMGGTRKTIFLAIGIFGVSLSLLNAILANVISKIIMFVDQKGMLNGGLTVTENGEEQFFNHISQLIGYDGLISRIYIDTSISFMLFSCLFIGGLIFYKFGIIGSTIVSAVLFLVILYAGNVGWLGSFANYLFENFSIVFFYQLFGVGVVVYLISFLFLRRLTLR